MNKKLSNFIKLWDIQRQVLILSSWIFQTSPKNKNMRLGITIFATINEISIFAVAEVHHVASWTTNETRP